MRRNTPTSRRAELRAFVKGSAVSEGIRSVLTGLPYDYELHQRTTPLRLNYERGRQFGVLLRSHGFRDRAITRDNFARVEEIWKTHGAPGTVI